LGYKINDYDIFYDSNHKKDFKFSIYLYFLKNKVKINDILICEQLKFDYLGYIPTLKLYENLNEDQIFDMYESMFQIGFDLSIKRQILNYRDFVYPAIKKTGFEFTQLICCLCQNGITKPLIKYLLKKYLHEYGYEQTQFELVKIINNSIYYYHWYINYYSNPRLKSSDLIILLDNLLDLLDENSLQLLRRIFRNNIDEFFDLHARGFVENYRKTSVINQTEYFVNYLYDRKYFKVFDYIFKYKLFNYRDIKNTLFHLHFCVIYYEYVYKKDVHLLAMMILYLLINKYFDKKKMFEWFRMLVNINKGRKIKFFKKIFISIWESYENICCKTPLKLTQIARDCIRNRIKNMSKFNLNKLNLPEHLADFIRESILLDKIEYLEICGHKINSILEDSEYKRIIKEKN
jgi:hypothetical protein